MPWKNDIYIYTPKMLRTIADCYISLYSTGIRIQVIGESDIIITVDPLATIEYKADFDTALNALKKRERQIIVNDILGLIEWSPFRLYSKMADYLNGVKNETHS